MLEHYNRLLGLYSGVFVGVALLLTPFLGSAGYIVANIVNMICRCAHHGLYLNQVSEKKIWRDILPNRHWLICLSLVSFLLCVNENRCYPYSVQSLLCHLSLGIGTGIIMISLIWVFDKTLIQEGMKILRNKHE